MAALDPQPRVAAPKDGRVYHGYFERSAPGSAMVKDVSWRPNRGWVDLHGEPIDNAWRLSAWSPS
jgi:hypothetical protein